MKIALFAALFTLGMTFLFCSEQQQGQAVPDLTTRVFHSNKGSINDLMSLQNASEVAFGTDTAFLHDILKFVRGYHVLCKKGLDVGSGTGIWTKNLLDTCSTVHAVDSYKKSLEELEKKLDEQEKRRVILQNEDFRSMQLPEGIDVVVANNSLGFVPRKEVGPVIASIHQHQSTGGIFAATFWGSRDVRAQDAKLATFSCQEIKELLHNKYSLLYFLSEEGDETNIDGELVHWHVISVIGQKQPSNC